MTEIKQPSPIPAVADDEIDLLALIKTMWKGRKILLICVFTGMLIGLFVAIFSPKEYTTSSVLVPQLNSDTQSALGSLSGLAALAGLSFDAGAKSELSPLIYPQIVNSIPFQLELMNTPVNFEEHAQPITLLEYYTKYSKFNLLGTIKKYTMGLPGLIIGAIKPKTAPLQLPESLGNKPIYLTEDQYKVKQALDALVTLEAFPKDGYLTLTVQMPEPLVTAQIGQKAQDLLQQYITEFKIAKVKANLDFIQGRYNEAKSEFEKAQYSLASVTDRNNNLTSSLSSIEKERVQTKYTIAYSVFQELAKQLEQAKIQVKKETPVFAIVQPVNIPNEKSKPKKILILFIWTFLGGLTGLGILFGKQYLVALREKWNAEEPKQTPMTQTGETEA